VLTRPDRDFPWGFLWGVAAFATAIALAELTARDYAGAAFQMALALFLAIQAMTHGHPVGWFHVARWSLVILMALLLVMR